MITQAEARMKAASIALEAVQAVKPHAWIPNTEDSLPIALELAKITQWLISQAAGGDKILARQLSKELGRQARPTARQAKQLGLREPKR